MADNYLERRMEDLRNGNISRSLSPHRPGSSPSALTGMRVLVCDATGDAGVELVRKFRKAGCRTAFLSVDRKAGNLLAQESGARFYPCDSISAEAVDVARADLRRHWKGIDMTVWPEDKE